MDQNNNKKLFTYEHNICLGGQCVTQVSPAIDRPSRRSALRPPCCTQNDVDGQCDKLVTDNGLQFTTLNVHLS